MENKNQIQKHSNEQLIQRQAQTMLIAKGILEGNLKVTSLELQLTIDKSFEKPLIRSVFKTDEEKLLSFGVVSMIVTKFLESFGFSSKPSQTMIDTITVDTLSKFQYETLDDIVIFFKMCRQGDFGTTGRGVDSNLIFGEWLPKYLEIKAEKRERIIESNKNPMTENNAVEQFYAKRRIEKARKEKEDRIRLEIDEMVKSMDRQMLEDTIVDWNKKEEMKPYIRLSIILAQQE